MYRVATNAARRAVTLIEAVLFISIALGLIVGGIVFFQQAQTSARTAKQTRVLSSIVAEVRQMTRRGMPGGIMNNITINTLLAAGALPADIIADTPGPTGSLVRTAWGGDLSMAAFAGPADPTMIFLSIILYEVPVAGCVRLSVIDATGNSPFGDGVTSVTMSAQPAAGGQYARTAGWPAIGGYTNRTFPVTPADAATMCDAADADNDGMIGRLEFSIRPYS